MANSTSTFGQAVISPSRSFAFENAFYGHWRALSREFVSARPGSYDTQSFLGGLLLEVTERRMDKDEKSIPRRRVSGRSLYTPGLVSSGSCRGAVEGRGRRCSQLNVEAFHPVGARSRARVSRGLRQSFAARGSNERPVAAGWLVL